MELNMLLEIIVLIFIIIEIYALLRHSRLEHRVEEHMEVLDAHIRKLDAHVLRVDSHLNTQNIEREDADQET